MDSNENNTLLQVYHGMWFSKCLPISDLLKFLPVQSISQGCFIIPIFSRENGLHGIKCWLKVTEPGNG